MESACNETMKWNIERWEVQEDKLFSVAAVAARALSASAATSSTTTFSLELGLDVSESHLTQGPWSLIIPYALVQPYMNF